MARRTKSKSNEATPGNPSPDPSLPTVAPHPFNQASADITLRTSDRVDFHVHSQILSQASPMFADMLSLPQPSSASQDTNAVRPVIDVAEDSKTLGRLLRLCYPIKKESLDMLDDVVPVFQAAMKYDMEWPVSTLTADLVSNAPRSPLRTWAVASRCGMEDLAQKAVESILKKATSPLSQFRIHWEEEEEKEEEDEDPIPTPISPLSLLKTMLDEQGKEVLRGISAADYFRLREYLRAGDGHATTRLLSPPNSPSPSNPTPERPALQDALIFSSPPPDTLLRCPDGLKIRVHAVILLLHSPLLGERLRAATDSSASLRPNRPAATADDDTESVSLEVDIDGATLSALLAVVYGGNAQLPSDCHALGAVLAAAIRFGMAQVTESAQGRWDSLSATSPLEAYFVAVEHGLTAHARLAARKVLERSIAGKYVPAMESGTALAYHHLLEYYQTCARTIDARMKAAVASRTSDFTRTVDQDRYAYGLSCSRSLQGPAYVAQTYLSSLGRTMDTDSPGVGCSFDLTLSALLGKSSSVWPRCTASGCQRYVEVLMKISGELPQVVADAIAEVQLEIE
uniref:AAA domain-containing protein n=1 Tax=Ganoderma boninense TaxID=34458 RepID=A0A5K1JVC5_9APHY|nr:AAA domain-containing protein [Ganoderma boninense]